MIVVEMPNIGKTTASISRITPILTEDQSELGEHAYCAIGINSYSGSRIYAMTSDLKTLQAKIDEDYDILNDEYKKILEAQLEKFDDPFKKTLFKILIIHGFVTISLLNENELDELFPQKDEIPLN